MSWTKLEKFSIPNLDLIEKIDKLLRQILGLFCKLVALILGNIVSKSFEL